MHFYYQLTVYCIYLDKLRSSSVNIKVVLDKTKQHRKKARHTIRFYCGAKLETFFVKSKVVVSYKSEEREREREERLYKGAYQVLITAEHTHIVACFQ